MDAGWAGTGQARGGPVTGIGARPYRTGKAGAGGQWSILRGVALIWNENYVSFKRTHIEGDERFELLACVGSVTGHGRKIIAINCYLPPNLAMAEAEECMCCIAGAVVDLKKRYSSPFMLIAGDFNQ